MRFSARKILAGILLALYIPVAPSIEFFHTDEVGGSSLPHQVVRPPDGRLGIAVSHDGVCLACLLAAGHFTQEAPSIRSTSFLFHTPSLGTTNPSSVAEIVRPARAPPVSSHTP